MMNEWLYDNDFYNKSNLPELTIFSMNMLDIPLVDYMHMALAVAKKGGMDFEIVESEDIYRFEFRLHGSVVMERQIPAWCNLIGGSELFIMSVCKDMPQTIRVSSYRMKEKQKQE